MVVLRVTTFVVWAQASAIEMAIAAMTMAWDARVILIRPYSGSRVKTTCCPPTMPKTTR